MSCETVANESFRKLASFQGRLQLPCSGNEPRRIQSPSSAEAFPRLITGPKRGDRFGPYPISRDAGGPDGVLPWANEHGFDGELPLNRIDFGNKVSLQHAEPLTAIGIDPTVDYAFKLLLGSPEHPAITLHFLNAILGDEIQITEVEILNPILGKGDDTDKLSILDIAARDSSGRVYDIEMQTSLPAGLAERLAYYTASLYVGQIGEGDAYTRLRPAISICVLDAIMFRESQPIHSDFRLRSREGNLNLTNGLQIHLLELPKYTPSSDHKVIADPVEAWAYFFRQADSMTTDEIQQRFNCPAFTEAAQVLDMIQRTPQQRSQYERRLKAQRDERARMEYAVDQARLEGEALGRISILRKILGGEPESLDSLSLEQLTLIEKELQNQLRERGI